MFKSSSGFFCKISKKPNGPGLQGAYRLYALKGHYFASTLAGALSRYNRSSIVTGMGLTLLPRYRVVLLSQRQVPKWGRGQNPGINLMLSMQCWAWMSHPHILIYI